MNTGGASGLGNGAAERSSERRLIGALVSGPAALADAVLAEVGPPDLGDPSCAAALAAVVELRDAGKEPTLLALSDSLQRNGFRPAGQPGWSSWLGQVSIEADGSSTSAALIQDARDFRRRGAVRRQAMAARAFLDDVERTADPEAHEAALTSLRSALATDGAGSATSLDPEKAARPPRAKAMVASSLPPGRPVSWLAKGWLPRSATAVLVGPEGIGKSLWWVEVAARVTTGRAFDAIGMPRRSPAAVVVVLTEDSRSEVEARLTLAGADLARVVFVACDEDLAEPPIFPDDMPVVVGAVEEHGAALVVVDAWLDTVDSRLSVKNPQQARQALLPWRTMANTTGAAVLLVGNSNRVGGEATIRDRIGATSTLRQAARMLIFAEVESQEQRGQTLWLGPDKSNTTGRQPAHRFRIDVRAVRPPTDDDPGTAAHLVPDGPADQPIEGLMAEWGEAEARRRRETTGQGARAGDRATAWLDEYMVPGESYPAVDLQHRARSAGISDSSLREAKRRLRVSSDKSVSGWFWTRVGDAS